MSSSEPLPPSSPDLRLRALSRLRVGAGPADRWVPSESAALGVLYELASSPDTAPDALALLHELQVHQVELALQAEELSRSRSELEATLDRYIQLYDAAPVSCCTLDEHTTLHEINLHAAARLGSERGLLMGQRLDAWLAPASGKDLREMLARIRAGSREAVARLKLLPPQGGPVIVQASASADPAGPHFLMAWVTLDEAG